MKLHEPQRKTYSEEQFSARKAQQRAQEIAWGPIVFQVSRLMIKFGIFEQLSRQTEGVTREEIVQNTKLSHYAVQILLESSLVAQTILTNNNKFFLAKTGWFLLNDPMSKININFNHDVNYLGLFDLEEALRTGKPEGLKRLGPWKTIYEGLSQLPPEVQQSWFGFDHFYSDNSFEEALRIVFATSPRTLLDVGGNTGRWAVQCLQYAPEVRVTIMDLPSQLKMMRTAVADISGAERIDGYGADLLDPATTFPKGYDAIWMSQFLDCFSEQEVISILTRAATSMSPESKLYIMETFWDRQQYETASFVLAQTSVYFTALANGNSKMYYSEDMERCVMEAGLTVEKIHDGLGLGHSIMQCRLK
ncbi:MAG: class I SAM-dependent methyltransferase [Alistipes sp.]